MRKTDKELHEDVYDQPREYFITAIHHFRGIMCSTEYTVEQKDEAFKSLMTDYLRCKLNKDDKLFMEATSTEWTQRRVYEVLRPAEEDEDECTCNCDLCRDDIHCSDCYLER